MTTSPLPLDPELNAKLQEARDDGQTSGVVLHTALLVRRLLELDSIYRLTDATSIKTARIDIAKLVKQVGTVPSGVSAVMDQVQRLRQNLKAPVVTARMLLAVIVTPGVMADSLSLQVAGVVVAAGLDRDRLLQGVSAPTRTELDFAYAPLGYGIDITAMAEGDYWIRNPAQGRDDEIAAILDVISGGYSVAITGLPGVGKTNVVDGLAWALTKGAGKSSRSDLRIISIDQKDLLSGTGVRGSLEERVGALIEHLKTHPRVIPFFDELHAILGGADETAKKVGELLKRPLASRAVRCIGATTDHEYQRYILKDGAIHRRFQAIQVHEPKREAAVEILREVAADLVAGTGGMAGLKVTDEALLAAVDLSIEHYRDEALPSKAIRLLRTAFGRQLRLAQQDPSAHTLTAVAIAQVVSDFRHVPLHSLTGDRVRRLLAPGGVREKLAARVVGQDHAIQEVVTWLALNADGCTEPTAPIGRFLFLGRPGCGKTELARALATELGREGGAVIEKPMAQYQSESSVSQFMGAAPGYVGYGETSTLFSQVRMRPYSVVVLDEIEKASQSLMPVLLSVLDGYAEDGQGIGVDFSKCVFVLTSNALAENDDLSTDELRRMGELTDEELRAELLPRGTFPPPFLDRLDRIVFFNPLSKDNLRRILDIKLAARKALNPRAIPAGFENQLDSIAEETLDRTSGTGRDLARLLLKRLRDAKQGQWEQDLGGTPVSSSLTVPDVSKPKRRKKSKEE